MWAGQGTTLRQMDWEGESAGQRLDKAPVEESASRGGKLEVCRCLELGGLGSRRSADAWSLVAWGWLPHACGKLDTLKYYPGFHMLASCPTSASPGLALVPLLY